ncbi:MAG TPA: extracellular solute-binding protein [Tepidisphaeraceae bacterium]|jgi:raffinose/stachyose/melibiose transport system permease protein|nr:extracellular solute-binding protein [Tepidisphaeraceae bacterium]
MKLTGVAVKQSFPTAQIANYFLFPPAHFFDYSPAITRLLTIFLLILSLGHLSIAAPEQPRATIEVALFAGGEGMEFYEQCKRDYEALHPDVHVNLYGDPRIDDKLRVRIIEGHTPDLTNAIELKYHELIQAGRMQSFEPWLDQPSFDTPGKTWRQTFIPGSLDKWTRDGKVYAIPTAYNVNAIWFNKTLFDQHHWPIPTTWDEFLDLCQKIKQAGIDEGSPGHPAYYPFAFQGMYPYYIRPLIDAGTFHSCGRQFYVDQQNALPGTFDNPRFIKVLSNIQKLALDYFEPGAMGMSHTQSQTDFFLGRTAMISCGAWLKSEMLGKIPDGFRLGCFNLPIVAGTAEPNAVNVFGGYMFLFHDAKQPAVAADFMRFLTSRRMAGLFSRLRDFPTSTLGTQQGNLSHDMDDMVAIMNRSTSSYGEAFNDTVAGMRQYWDNCELDVCTGRHTPEQIARDMEAGAAQVRQLLANPNHITVRHLAKPIILLSILLLGAIYWIISTTRALLANRRRPQRISAGRGRLALGPLLVFILPALLLYTFFVIIPCLRSFSWSLHDWNGFTPMTWAGLLHFKRLLFEDDLFWIALDNNLFIMFVIPAFVLPISLFLAVCINRGVWGSTLFRVAFFLPNIIGGVAATLLWLHLYNPQGGPVNAFLSLIGFHRFDGFPWLSQQNLYWALVPMSVWAACGFNMILFLAAMQGIPDELYEAADLDGASPWQQFWTLTLPMIWSAVSVSVVFLIIGGMKAFEVIWLLTNQQPGTNVQVVGTVMIQELFWKFHIGQASAIAVILFLIVFIGTAATLKLMNQRAMDVS